MPAFRVVLTAMNSGGGGIASFGFVRDPGLALAAKSVRTDHRPSKRSKWSGVSVGRNQLFSSFFLKIKQNDTPKNDHTLKLSNNKASAQITRAFRTKAQMFTPFYR